MKRYNRLRAVIDLDAVMFNIERMHKNLNGDAKIIAVLKADAYGHGAGPIARMLEPVDYVWGYAVSNLEEGCLLRKEGVKKPILCMGCIFPDQFETMIREEIRMTVTSAELAGLASKKAVQLGKSAVCHVKIDTGMSRLGFPVCEESVEEILKISSFPGLKMEGMFTHFSRADEAEKTITKKQADGYQSMQEMLKDRGLSFPYYHCANSAAIIDMPELQKDLVRAGIATYGMYPSEEVDKSAVALRPAMELFAHVTHVKWIEPDTAVSYGGTFTAEKRMRVATIPAGYGDGYPRSLSGKGYVLIHGQKAPILGRICMDQFMVDVTDIPDVKFGDQVTLIGRDGDAFLPVEVLSEMADRFNYEFVCDINKRVPREYLKNGVVVEQSDCF